jgi:GT2 family glycosyltransferase
MKDAGVDPAATPEVVVAVSTYGRPDLLPRLVAALERQTFPRDSFEVVVVDNGSSDSTFDVLTALASTTPIHLTPVRLEQNRGPAAARNVAWRTSHAPLVAFTDDDCEPDPKWLEAGVKALRWSPEVGVVQGRTEKPVDADHYPWTDWTVYREIRWPTPWFEGCNLFFRRDALEATGGFDEGIGWFGEETALGWAVVSAGWERAFEDGAVIRHDLGERGVRWHMRNRYNERNLIGIAERYPRFRQSFWRPWAVHRENVVFAVALVGLAVGVRRPAALVLTLPYLRQRKPHWGHPRFVRLLGERVAVDAAALAGMVRGSVEHRRLVL